MHTTVTTFDHEGRSFEIKMDSDGEGWHLKVFVDGEPTKVDGGVSHEVQQDAALYEIGDPRRIIADALEGFIKGKD
ncbi:hypothetical protein [Sagittula salina]|uniref:Uncharacterized protein n=1 Tax=Sagittula salina TaxID=2820268 RepID=A0A940MQH9_9RHOB|nr:hypothetical protein [Sagittula salina]MBP0482926.1 hypothetical protein [Sagittula salina]